MIKGRQSSLQSYTSEVSHLTCRCAGADFNVSSSVLVACREHRHRNPTHTRRPEHLELAPEWKNANWSLHHPFVVESVKSPPLDPQYFLRLPHLRGSKVVFLPLSALPFIFWSLPFSLMMSGRLGKSWPFPYDILVGICIPS